jgi:predicted DNA-binding transcriptional regulator AlpA
MATHATKHYDLLTGEQAAKLAGVSRQRISQAMHEGKLAYIPFSLRCVRYYRKDVIAWIRNSRRPVRKFKKGYCVQQ